MLKTSNWLRASLGRQIGRAVKAHFAALEAEDEQALAALNLATAMQGNLRSHSLRAYSADEMDKILAKLP